MADFEYKPDYVYAEATQFNTVVTQFENGVEQRRAVRDNPIRTFTLEFRNRDATEMGLILAHFNAKQGALTAFTFLNPNDSAQYNVRYSEDSLNIERKTYGYYDFSFKLVEVL